MVLPDYYYYYYYMHQSFLHFELLDRHHAWRSLDPTLGISSPFVKKKKAF